MHARLLLIAAACCLAGPAAAAPRYELALLPDLGNGSHARTSRAGGGVFVAAGDVNGDGANAQREPALWLRKGRKWSLHLLSAPGDGGSAAALRLDPTGGSVNLAGTVRDEEGTDTAALWIARPTRRGWTDKLFPLTAIGEGASDVAAFLEGNVDRPVVLGTKDGPLPGQHRAALWTFDPLSDAVTETELPTPGGESAEAVAGAALPGGSFRILGCARLAGTQLELAVEWVGNPQQGFTWQWLPSPGPGLDEYHVLDADPMLRYAVGAKYSGDSFEPAAWATALSTAGPFTALALPETGTAAAHLYSVNSTGRALGLADHPLADDLAFIQRVNVPASDSRRLPVSSYLEDENRDGDFDDIGERGVISGSVSIGGRRRSCLLLPGSTEAPDFAIIEEIPIPSALTLGDLEKALVWDDTDIVHINQQTPADWNELRLEFDVSRFQFAAGVSQLGASTRGQTPAVLVTARVDGPRAAEVLETLFLWNVQQQRWDPIHSLKVRGGQFQKLRHPLPASMVAYVSAVGSLQLRLVHTPVSGRTHSFDVLVNSCVTNARELALDD